MRLRTIMLATAAIGASFLAPNISVARDFTVASWGGAYQDGLREIFFTPFSKAEGIVFLEDTYLGGWAQFEAMKSTGVYNWDVVQVETTELFKGCEDGTFLKLDWDKIAERNDLVKGAANTCGLGAVIAGHVLAFNNDKIGDRPVGLEDFWDTKRWPGKRGMRKGPKYNLELALLADGVEPSKVYEILSQPAGVDRAFAKLDQIKPMLQLWESGAQPIQWLTSGDVTMSIAYNGRVDAAVKNGQPIGAVWNRFTYDMDQWVILANSEYQDAGYRFLNFYTDAKREAALAQRVGYGVPNGKATNFIPEGGRANLPLGEKMSGGLFAGSEEAMAFWLDHDEELTERWNAWTNAN